MFLNSHEVSVPNNSHYARDTSDKNSQHVEPDSPPSKRRRLDEPDRPISEPEQYQANLIEPQQAAFGPASPRPLDNPEVSPQVQSPGEDFDSTVFGHKGLSAPDRVVPGPVQRSIPHRYTQALCSEAKYSEITAQVTPEVTSRPPFDTWNLTSTMSTSYGPMHASPPLFLPPGYQPYALPSLSPRPAFESGMASSFIPTGLAGINSSQTMPPLERRWPQKRRYAERDDNHGVEQATRTSPRAYQLQSVASERSRPQLDAFPAGIANGLYPGGHSPSLPMHYSTSSKESSGSLTYATAQSASSSVHGAPSYGYEFSAGPQFHPVQHSFSYSAMPPNLPPNHAQEVLHPLDQGQFDQSQYVAEKTKAQCWDHGCNGRQFSTFSNLLRHQREKSGAATKSYCPRCGAEFTRTTARNGHMMNEKCKTRRSSEAK